MSPILDSIGSVKGFGWGSFVQISNSFESIATISVTSNTTYLDFQSIPQTYSHLQIRGIGRQFKGLNQSSLDGRIFFNGSYGGTSGGDESNYTLHSLGGNGSSVDVYGNSGVGPYLVGATGDGAAAGIFSASIIDILDYTNTNKFKTVRSLTGNDRNGSGSVSIISTLWRSTSAITSIQLYPYTNTTYAWTQYSHFALYGIKGAA